MLKTIALSLFVVSAAQAHVEPGLYKGKTAAGAECQMTAIRQYYQGDVAHPLNERIVVQQGGVEFTVGHPPVIVTAQDMAYFNHDAFHGILPTATGARAFVIDMSHASGEGKPVNFHVIDHQWKTNTRQAIHCLDIKLSR